MGQNKYKPNYAIPPAETVKEIIVDRNITLSRLEKMSGIDYERLMAIMGARIDIGEQEAYGLERALGIPKEFWLNLEKTYQETLKRLEIDGTRRNKRGEQDDNGS